MAHFILALIMASSAGEPTAFTVEATSPRMGLTFTDAEPVDVRAGIANADSPVTIAFRVREVSGPWEQTGEVTLAELEGGAGEVVLPLELPGRGLYTLSLEARCGNRTATAEASLGIVFAPEPVAEDSHWGIFYIPFTFEGRTAEQSMVDIARNIRLLGASWVRFNFWAHTYGKVTITPGDPPLVTGDWSEAKKMVRALRAEGLHIMGEIAQCPRELSSQPDATDVTGDAGPVYNRVKPADYALWDPFIERLARDFADDIGVWEIWNEANLPNAYWTGTVEDFAELIHHTSAALRAGNPAARVAAAGFVGGHDFADRLFELGAGEDIDILTVHYTDPNPEWLPAWKALLAKHDLDLPVWNSEELSEVPVRNLAAGVEHSFKFCHIHIGYDAFRLLVNQDLTPRPPAIRFSVGAHCLGGAQWVEHQTAPGCEVDLFRRGEELIAVVGPQSTAAKLFEACRSVVLAAEPVAPDAPITLTDDLGRTTELAVEDGRVTCALVSDRFVRGARRFINGARSVKVISTDLAQADGVVVFEAESGRFSPGWGVSDHDGFSGGKTVDTWSDADPDADGHWFELGLTAPADGRYELIFAGNSLGRLEEPPSISPFTWQIDGGPEHQAADAEPVGAEVPGAPEGASILGALDLTAGDHTFRLKLAGRRAQPDTHYALWIDALALRRVE